MRRSHLQVSPLGGRTMGAWIGILKKFTVMDGADILIVAYVLFRFLLLIRGTRAVQLLKGVIVILLATAFSSLFQLRALNWLLGHIITVGLFAIPVVFQPELRRALERLGSGGFFAFPFTAGTGELQQTVLEVVKASQVLAKNRIGALVVIERGTGLTEYIETGTLIEGKVSSELLINTFVPNTPLHDGAVIIRGNRVVAAGCFLPLTENRDLDRKLGTRHRAAIGLTEQSDGLVLVVSEETGQISLAVDGVLTRNLSESALIELLQSLLVTAKSSPLKFFGRKAES